MRGAMAYPGTILMEISLFISTFRAVLSIQVANSLMQLLKH